MRCARVQSLSRYLLKQPGVAGDRLTRSVKLSPLHVAALVGFLARHRFWCRLPLRVRAGLSGPRLGYPEAQGRIPCETKSALLQGAHGSSIDDGTFQDWVRRWRTLEPRTLCTVPTFAKPSANHNVLKPYCQLAIQSRHSALVRLRVDI